MKAGTGADFYRAMAATDPGEKLPKERHRARNWTCRMIPSLFCAENYICSSENQQKLLPQELHFLTPICTKSFVGWGFATDPTGRAYSAPQTHSCIWGPTSKGMGGRGREGEVVRPLPEEEKRRVDVYESWNV